MKLSVYRLSFPNYLPTRAIKRTFCASNVVHTNQNRVQIEEVLEKQFCSEYLFGSLVDVISLSNEHMLNTLFNVFQVCQYFCDALIMHHVGIKPQEWCLILLLCVHSEISEQYMIPSLGNMGPILELTRMPKNTSLIIGHDGEGGFCLWYV
jgi:hypothetical protein